MRDDGQLPAGDDSLARIASLRDCGGSRDDLIRRFLEDAAADDRIADAHVLLRGEGGRAHHYYLRRGMLHRAEIEEVDQRPFGAVADGADTFTGGVPEGIGVAGDAIVSLPVRSGDALSGALFLGLPGGARDHSLYPRLRELAAFLGVGLDNIRVLDEARRESQIDHLTGIYNYRCAMETLQREIDRAKRFRHSFSILMIDLDRFKEYNDRHGHVVGNDTLREIAQLFRRSVRSVDTAAKYGGDEFILILPNTDREGAGQLARRLLEEMDHIAVGGELRVSASIGVASCPDDGTEIRALIESADRALYRAKGEGGGGVRS